jgi:protein gp37
MRSNNGLFDPPAIVREAQDELAAIAKKINTEHKAGERSAKRALRHYRHAGGELRRAKMSCKRKGVRFDEWVEKNIEFSYPTARRYMQIAKHWQEVRGASSLQEALDLLSSKKHEGNDDISTSEVSRKAHGGNRFNRQDSDGIEWALWSWNPVTGCLHDCPYCYARDIANRLFAEKFKPTFHPKRLAAVQKTTFPQAEIDALHPSDPQRLGLKNVFVCSMADLFGRWVPAEWIERVLECVRSAPQWNFLFLTKFPIRLAEFEFPNNAWVGTTVDCQARVANAEKAFRKVKAGIKWLSLEPLLEPLTFRDLGAFQWIVLGGASSSTQTPEWQPPVQWYESIEKEAIRLGIPFYEKPNLRRFVKNYPGEKPIMRATTTPKPLLYLPTVEAK